jgi:hypothetical protein
VKGFSENAQNRRGIWTESAFGKALHTPLQENRLLLPTWAHVQVCYGYTVERTAGNQKLLRNHQHLSVFITRDITSQNTIKNDIKETYFSLGNAACLRHNEEVK